MWGTAVLVAAAALVLLLLVTHRGVTLSRLTLADKREARWALVAPLFVAFWSLGLGFMWWLIVPPLLFLSVRRSASRSQPPAGSHAAIWLGGWLLLILGVALISDEQALPRAPGAVFGALVWVSAGLMLMALNRAPAASRWQFFQGLALVALMQGALTLIAVQTYPGPLSSVTLPSAAVLGSDEGGVAPWTTANLAYADYFGDSIVRSSGMMATAAWSGGFACLMALTLILKRSHLRGTGMSRWFWMATTLASLVSLYYSYSRVSWALFVVVAGVATVMRLSASLGRGGSGLGVIVCTTVLVLAGVLLPWTDYLTAQDELRPGSSVSRAHSYTAGIEVGTSQGPLVTLAGSGVKPYLDALGRGAGSESTYVSLFVRGGVVAVAILLVFLLARTRDAVRRRDWAAVAMLGVLAIHAVVEDLDVGTLTLLLVLVDLSGGREGDSHGEHRGRSQRRAGLQRAVGVDVHVRR